MNCLDAITQSCDVFFYEVAKRVGIERIADMARRLGLGEPLGIDLPGERGGLIPSPEWKKATVGSSWQKGETVILGIGQGYILTTPLQLATMTARLVNGGMAVKPHLTRQIVEPGGETSLTARQPAESIGVSPSILGHIRKAMGSVVNDPYGTAFRSRIENRDEAMGGKTGTVQVRRISKAEREQGVRKNKDMDWEDRDHALFVGYAPIDNPRFSVAVVVEHGGSGSSAAAPVARDVLQEVQRLGIAAATSDANDVNGGSSKNASDNGEGPEQGSGHG